MFTIRRGRGGKVSFLTEEPVKHSLYTGLGRDMDLIQIFPFVQTSFEFIEGDVVLICRSGNHHLKDILRYLRLPGDVWEEEGYGITLNEVDGRRVLLISGSDLVNLASAISYVLDYSAFSQEGLEYRGKTIVRIPEFEYRVFWTWDRRVSWGRDGSVRPAKAPNGEESPAVSSALAFVDEYKRLIDFCQQSSINGLVVWGFLRDSHGGVEAGQEICNYAKRRGVRLLPGVGTSRYGGFYLSGNHPFSTERWLEVHPHLAAIDRKGQRVNKLCPSRPENIEWLKEGTHWFLETFDVGGLNLEHGNYSVCYCELCLERKAKSRDIDYYQDMVASTLPVITEALKERDDLWLMYATYTGFNPGEPVFHSSGIPVQPVSQMGIGVPDFISSMPQEAICQWTLTGMLHDPAIPMLTLLDDGVPEILSWAPRWPKGVRPPAPKNCGYFHQRRGAKGGPIISSIKEAALRGAVEGLQGLVIYGEISWRDVAQELNYLAFSHFLFHPEDSLRDFAEVKLSPLVGGSELAQRYIEFLAKIEIDRLTHHDRAILSKILGDLRRNVKVGKEWGPYHRWQWLSAYSNSIDGEVDFLNDT